MVGKSASLQFLIQCCVFAKIYTDKIETIIRAKSLRWIRDFQVLLTSAGLLFVKLAI
jgi:hypothetical protein